jgi:hypothetical protein
MGAAPSQVFWEHRPAAEQHRGGTLLTLAIVSLFCCGIILGPIVALRAGIDLGAMRDGRMDPTGEGMTRAALVIGIVSAVLHALLIMFRLSGSRF